MSGRRTGEAGFTLVELLIALSLLGMTMATVVALFSSGMRLRAVTAEGMEFERDARSLIGALTDDLGSLVPAGPAPTVTADSIVLWRLSGHDGAGSSDDGVPVLVAYQWSGPMNGDGRLVRVSAPLKSGAADPDLVGRAFLDWSRLPRPDGRDGVSMTIEDRGERFGDRAVMNDRSGSWTAYPGVRSFACGITTGRDVGRRGGEGSRILIKISSEPWNEDAPVPDPALRLALIPEGGKRLEAGFWLPVAAETPGPADESPHGEVSP